MAIGKESIGVLSEEDRQFAARRRRFATSWPIVGAVLLAGLAVLVAALFWQCPLLVNPFMVASRIQAEDLQQSTLLLMAAMLPYVVLVCFAIVLTVIAFMFCAMANERRHLRIIDRVLQSTPPSGDGVYMIVDISVTNSEVYAQYVEKVADVVRRHGGRYVVRGGKVTPIVGDWRPERIIVVRFDTIEQLQECFASAEYLELAPLREQSTRPRAIAVERLPSHDVAAGAS